MDEHDEAVALLTDPETARQRTGWRVGPEGEDELRSFVRLTNKLAVQAAHGLDLPYALRFAVLGIERYRDDAAEDGYVPELEGAEESETVRYFKVVVRAVPRGRAEQSYRWDCNCRASARRLHRELHARRLRGPRRRGAGRPGHRARQRANAPPAGDEPAEPEPDRVARRARRAACCWGAWR